MARNPIIIQRELAAKAAEEAKKNPAPPPPPPGTAASKPEKVAAPVDNRLSLETLPDSELAERAEAIYKGQFDPTWDRDQLIDKLLEKGAKA